jgi:RNA polymerase sigma factor (sigma-70 family)
MNNKEQDEEIIAGIRLGGLVGERALCSLYDQMRSIIFDFVEKNKGTRTEGQDLLQDVMVIVYDQIRHGKYVYQSKLSTYVYSVARHIWLNRLKRKKTEARIVDDLPYEEIQESSVTEMIIHENEKQIKSVFELLGPDCRQLLIFIIYDNLTMKEVYERMHYQNEQIVRNKKYKCLKQLKEILSTRPQLMSILKSSL